MSSIRSFLLTRLLGGSALVLCAAGAGVYLLLLRAGESQFDRALAGRVDALASLLFQEQQRVDFEFSDQLMPEYERAQSPVYFELRFADGRLLERSGSLRGGELALQPPPASGPGFWDAALPDGRPGRYVVQRVVVHHVYPEEGPDRPQAAELSIGVALGREELQQFSRSVLGQCALVGLLLLLLIAGVAWLAVERGLAPARRLGARLDALRVDRLPRRFDAGVMPRELAPVGAKIEALIARVDEALQRERRTTADIAHELRTPISELLTVSEVALREGANGPAARRALATVRDVAWRMGHSLSTLLALARLEAGGEGQAAQPEDIAGLLGEILRAQGARARERGIQVENHVPSALRIRAERETLRIIASNLICNALEYSPRGGRVTLGASGAEAGGSLWVENEAPDLGEEDLRCLGEPFWRKEGARPDSGHSGLGLALARRLAERSGLVLRFELAGSRLRVGLESQRASA